MTHYAPAHQSDYPGLARQRAKRRSPSVPARTGGKPYGNRRPNRYAALATPPAKPEPVTAAAQAPLPAPQPARAARPGRVRPQPAETPTVEPLPISLREEFARVKQGQANAHHARRIALRRPRRPVLTAIAAVGAVAVLIAAVVLGPVVYRGTRAYQNIFEDQVPHNDSPFVVAVNPDGTKEIVPATATAAGAEIPAWDGKDRLTILLLGVDRREDEASRSDTMILVNIDPVTKRAAMLSIPRDMKVIIPGYGVHKINAAYAFGDADEVPGGGPGLTIRTIEANFGIRVNYYAQVDFNGFVKIIDTIGGLTLDVPYPIKDDEYPGPGNQYMRIYFEPGWQHMNGERALQYARTRHDDGDGRRSARQQQVLLALRQQAVSLDLISKAPELLTQLGDAIRTDIEPTKALQLARLASEIDPSAIVQYSLDPALVEEQLPDQPYYLVADWNAVGEILSEFTGETVIPPMAAVTPNYDLEIVIEDGTLNPGLGSRVEQVLRANGFHNVSVVDKPDLGNYPTSSLETDAGNLTTAYLIAGVLGLDLSAISVPDSATAAVTAESTATTVPVAGNSPSPAGTVDAVPLFPTPAGGSTADPAQAGGRLVIVLGDDAPDPAYFTSEPFVDEWVPAEDTSPIDESIDGGGDETGEFIEEAPAEE